MGKWRYGCVKRTYKTITPALTCQETTYELAEVYDHGKSWTKEPVSPYSNTKKGLIEMLKRAIKDLEEHDPIVERKPIIRIVGEKK